VRQAAHQAVVQDPGVVPDRLLHRPEQLPVHRRRRSVGLLRRDARTYLVTELLATTVLQTTYSALAMEVTTKLG
jgi:hypothetical protein